MHGENTWSVTGAAKNGFNGSGEGDDTGSSFSLALHPQKRHTGGYKNYEGGTYAHVLDSAEGTVRADMVGASAAVGAGRGDPPLS